MWNLWSRKDNLVAATSEVAGHEVRRTQDMQLASSWRVTGLTGQYITCIFSRQWTMSAVAIVGSNLTNLATVRVRIGNSSSFATNLLDSGLVKFREPIYTSNELAVGHLSEFFDGNGLPWPETQPILKKSVRVFYFNGEVSAQAVRIDVNDPTNPDGYIDIPYVYAGRVFIPNPDVYYGWKVFRDDTARMPQSSCGQFWSASVFKRIRLSCTIAPQKETDLLGQWFLMQYLNGINTSFIVSIERRKDSLKFYTTIYGKFFESPKNQNIAYHRFTIPMEIEEIIA